MRTLDFTFLIAALLGVLLITPACAPPAAETDPAEPASTARLENIRQLTFGGFTSFAELSPDGKRVVFSSSLDAKSRYEFKIFIADWAE